MSTGQMGEIFFILVMPFCFARLGVKKMLIVLCVSRSLRIMGIRLRSGWTSVPDLSRHSAAWHLLRLLLRDGDDLHRRRHNQKYVVKLNH